MGLAIGVVGANLDTRTIIELLGQTRKDAVTLRFRKHRGIVAAVAVVRDAGRERAVGVDAVDHRRRARTVGEVRAAAAVQLANKRPAEVLRGEFADVIAVPAEQLVGLGIAVSREDRAAAPVLANKGIRIIRIVIVSEAIAAVDLHAIETLDRDEVHHARDRVRTIDGGTAVGNNLDILDHAGRNHVRIGRGRCKPHAHHAVAVHQHERARPAAVVEAGQVTQVGAIDRNLAAGCERLLETTERTELRNGLQHLVDAGCANLLNRFGANTDRAGARRGDAAHQGAGHDDLVATLFLGNGFGARAGLVLRKSHARQNCRQRNAGREAADKLGCGSHGSSLSLFVFNRSRSCEARLRLSIISLNEEMVFASRAWLRDFWDTLIAAHVFVGGPSGWPGSKKDRAAGRCSAATPAAGRLLAQQRHRPASAGTSAARAIKLTTRSA